MRYVIIILLHTLLYPGQSQDLVTVANDFLNDKNYIEAKRSIDEAFVKSDLSNNARAWYTKGRIYHEILKNNDPSVDQFKTNISEFVEEIVEAYEKAKEITGRGNNLFVLSDNYVKRLWEDHINLGYDRFQKQEFTKALEAFDIAKVIKPQDSTGYLYAGISAQNARQFDLAIENYMALKKFKTLSIRNYHNIMICMQARGDDLNTRLDLIEEAIYHHPDVLQFIFNEHKILVAQKRYEEAESRLKTVLQRNPDTHDLIILSADLFDRVFQESYLDGQPERSERYFDKASASYEQFIELYPTHFTALHNYAVMINERANRYYVSANLMSEEEYQISGIEIEELGHNWTRKALPFMERALAVKPNDENALKALRAFYKRLKLDDKLAQLNNR